MLLGKVCGIFWSKYCSLISIIDCYDFQYIGTQHMTGCLEHFFPTNYNTFLKEYSKAKTSFYFYSKTPRVER